MHGSSWKNLLLPLCCVVGLAACGDDSGSPAAAAPANPGSGISQPGSPAGSPGSNSAPTIQGSPQIHVMAGRPYNFSPAAVDRDGDTLGYFIVNRPAWAAFDAATGRLHGTPSAADLGPWPGIEIGASDGTARASLPLFAITVASSPAGAVLVGWSRPSQNTDNSSLTNLAGYRVYWGTDPNRLTSSATIRTIGLTNHVVEPLDSGTWYFAVTAFNDQNVESDPSQTVVAVIN